MCTSRNFSEEMAVKVNASSRQQPVDFTGDVVKLSWDEILPRPGDTLADLVARREKVAAVICAGHSLAVALGVLDSGHDAPSAEEVAEPNFNEVERRVQAYFEEKGQLPKMNFDKDRLAKSTQPGGKNVKERRRLALARLYGKNTEEVTLGNVYYVESKMSPVLPLITRMDKIICAERRLATIDSWEQVEFRTVKQVHSKLVAAENSVMAEHKWLVKQSESHRETFNGRLLSARAKDSSKQHPNHLGQ